LICHIDILSTFSIVVELEGGTYGNTLWVTDAALFTFSIVVELEGGTYGNTLWVTDAALFHIHSLRKI
jgi:hypothetical protein